MGPDGCLSDSTVMLVSVRARYVERILAGTKTVELRRSVPSVVRGQTVAIYETLPRGAIVATCEVQEVVELPPDLLWNSLSNSLGIAKADYDSYFAGRARAVGMLLTNVKELAEPVGLDEMRRLGVPNPPQQWSYLTSQAWRDRLCLVREVAA